MYTHDPVAALRGLVGLARPGAVVAFEEIDFAVLGWAMHPPGPVFAQANGWLREAFVRLGAHPAMGFELHATFLAAGLPAPALRLNALVGAGPDCDLYEIHAGVIASLLPKLVELGLATVEEVGVETLAAQLRDEAVALGATTSSSPADRRLDPETVAPRRPPHRGARRPPVRLGGDGDARRRPGLQPRHDRFPRGGGTRRRRPGERHEPVRGDLRPVHGGPPDRTIQRRPWEAGVYQRD